MSIDLLWNSSDKKIGRQYHPICCVVILSEFLQSIVRFGNRQDATEARVGQHTGTDGTSNENTEDILCVTNTCS